MTTTIAETKKRRELVEEARAAAVRRDWDEAVRLNERLIEAYAGGVEEYNRLGKALSELGRVEEARQPYAAALRLDPLNAIAARNLARLDELARKDWIAAPIQDRLAPAFFLEEAGKTALTRVILAAQPADVARVLAGDPVELRVEGGEVTATVRGVLIGHLEPNLALRLIALTRAGNLYRAGVESAVDGDVVILVREVERAPAGRPSFAPIPVVGTAEAGPYVSELEGIEDSDLDGYLEKYDEYEEQLGEEEREEQLEEQLQAIEEDAALAHDEGVEIPGAEELEEKERLAELVSEEELVRP